MASKILNIVALLGILLFLTSCSIFKYTAPKDFKMPVLTTNKIPLRIGLYIPPDVRYYKITEKQQNYTFHFQIGDALCDGIERMLRIVFDDIVILESSDFDVTKHGIKAVVVPKIVSGNFRLSAAAFGEGTGFIIRVKYTAIDSSKRVLWVDTFEGKSRKRQPVFRVREVYTDCMRLSLEDHFHNALEGILLSKWWKAIKN